MVRGSEWINQLSGNTEGSRTVDGAWTLHRWGWPNSADPWSPWTSWSQTKDLMSWSLMRSAWHLLTDDTCPSSVMAMKLGDGPNTVSESTVSNTELSEFFGAHWVPGTELSEFLSAYYLCANANSPSFSQNSPSLPQNSVSSLLRNSTLETVFRPFPRNHDGILDQWVWSWASADREVWHRDLCPDMSGIESFCSWLLTIKIGSAGNMMTSFTEVPGWTQNDPKTQKKKTSNFSLFLACGNLSWHTFWIIALNLCILSCHPSCLGKGILGTVIRC